MKRTFQAQHGLKVEYDTEAGRTTRTVVRTVRVLPNWRICYHGRAYGPGETADVDVLTAAEWTAWGSVSPVGNRRVVDE